MSDKTSSNRKTESRTMRKLRGKIESCLTRLQVNYSEKPDGAYWLKQGSTIVAVKAFEKGKRAFVKLSAPVALEISKITPELTRFLVEKNYELLFGKFSLDTKGETIWFEHVLLGDYLDAEELFIGVAAVAGTADEYDEQVSKMADGKRATDMSL